MVLWCSGHPSGSAPWYRRGSRQVRFLMNSDVNSDSAGRVLMRPIFFILNAYLNALHLFKSMPTFLNTIHNMKTMEKLHKHSHCPEDSGRGLLSLPNSFFLELRGRIFLWRMFSWTRDYFFEGGAGFPSII